MALSDYLDEVEPVTMMVVGFVLFVVPEPATSALGAGLLSPTDSMVPTDQRSTWWLGSRAWMRS